MKPKSLILIILLILFLVPAIIFSAEWTPMSGINTDSPIYDIWGSSGKDVNAVADQYLLHFDGKEWSGSGPFLSPQQLPMPSHLR